MSAETLSSQLGMETDAKQLVRLGNYDFWIPEGVRGRDAIRVALPILDGDEYKLFRAQRDGHQVHTVVDVGANCGAFCVRVADLFPGVKIIAFEPDPASATICRCNMQRLDSEYCLSEAVVLGADAPRTCSFWRFFEEPASNCAAPSAAAGIAWTPLASASETIQVPCVRLPEVLESHGVTSIDILKLDCEGAEAVILEDLSTTGWLETTRWVRFEWHGRPSLLRCRAALASTHIAWTEEWPERNGFGLAHARKDMRS